MRYLLILSVMLLFCFDALPQNITGTWQGRMTNEFVQINIEQKGNQLCGYTYDYILDDRQSRCIATFEGLYDPAKKIWYIYGRRFVENSGGHVLMKMVFWNEVAYGKNTLKGRVFTSSLMGQMLDDGDSIEVKRISAKPQQLGNLVPPCFPPPPKVATKKKTVPNTAAKAVTNPVPLPLTKPIVTTVKKTQIASPKASTDSASANTPQQHGKSEVYLKQAPLVTGPLGLADRQLIQKMNDRKQLTQSKTLVNVRHINLKVYDNGTVDNDSVSIFYNGRLLMSRQRLSESPIEFNIDLDEGKRFHEFTLFAENLGSIAPNTALIVITAGDKRYELRSKASMEENAVLLIEYRPK